MAIPVRIEAKAWTDPRYQALAIELGMARARHALIAVADIWQWQTEHYTDERPTYCVPRAVIVGALEHRDGPEAMVAAGLAEAQPDGTFRIRGGKDDKGESRIDWLYRHQLAQAERGRRRAEKAGSEGRQGGKFTSRQPAGHQPEGVRAPATDQPPTSSPISNLRTPDPEISLTAGAREPTKPADPSEGWQADVPGKHDAPPPARGADSILALLTEAAAALNAERVRWSPDAPPIDESTAAGVTARLMATPAADRRRKLMHAVACVIARAKRTRSVDGLRWSTFGSEQAWAYVVDASVAEYARSGQRPGHGARDSPGRRQQPDPPRPPVSRL